MQNHFNENTTNYIKKILFLKVLLSPLRGPHESTGADITSIINLVSVHKFQHKSLQKYPN